MNGNPRCQKCGSWDTVAIPMSYGERWDDIIMKGGLLGGLILGPVLALVYKNHIIKCKQCGAAWHY